VDGGVAEALQSHGVGQGGPAGGDGGRPDRAEEITARFRAAADAAGWSGLTG
jgi:hypothetical protein